MQGVAKNCQGTVLVGVEQSFFLTKLLNLGLSVNELFSLSSFKRKQDMGWALRFIQLF